MKYKLLLTGNNKELITSFFSQMTEAFECLCSSSNYNDLTGHLNYFQPSAVVYCPKDETHAEITAVSKFRDDLSKDEIPYIVAASIGDYSDIERTSAGKSKLVLRIPISTISIKNSITDFITNDLSFDSNPIGASTDAILSGDSTFDMLAQINAEMADLGLGPAVPATPKGLTLEPELGMRRILVIDDSTIVHRTVKSFLDDKYEIATAINGKVAMRYLQSKRVSLILLDYEMPGINGPELLAKIKEFPELANIPVIFLTCINDVEKIQKALALKPQGYLLKPIDKEALTKKITEIIG